MIMSRGFATLEILIALFVVSVTLVAVTLVTLGMPYVLESARAHREALALSSGSLARELSRGAGAFDTLTSSATTTDGTYAHSLSIEIMPGGIMKRLVSRVEWHDSFGKTRSLSLETLASDYENAAGNACPGLPIGDWDSPSVRTSSLTLPPIAGSAFADGMLIAIASTTRANGDPVFFSFMNPEISLETSVRTMDNLASTTVGYLAVAASSRVAYAITAESTCPDASLCARLDSVRIEAESDPEIIDSYPIPPARSVLYQGGQVYVGLRANPAWPELLVFSTDSSGIPDRIGDAEIGFSVNSLVTSPSSLFLATSDNRSGGGAVQSFDRSDIRPGMHAASASALAGAGISQRITRLGHSLYVGRSAPLNSKELYVLAAEDITHESFSRDMDSSITGMAVRGPRAFLLTKTALSVWNMTGTGLTKDEYEYTLPIGTNGTSLSCSSHSIYMGSGGNGHGYVTAFAGS